MHNALMHGRTIFFTAVMTLVACGPLATEDTVPAMPEEQGNSVAVAASAVVNGWSAFTSEEFAPVGCGTGNLITRMQCSGAYCDNVAQFCQSVPNVTFGDVLWSTYFSEEGTNNRTCGAGSWMTGFVCRGGNCDDMSIQCTRVTNRAVGTCRWADRTFSEEFPSEYDLPAGWFARGLACTGARCDNLRVFECQML